MFMEKERKIFINFGNTQIALTDLGHNVNDQFVLWCQSMLEFQLLI